jgi:hypothetical protein
MEPVESSVPELTQEEIELWGQYASGLEAERASASQEEGSFNPDPIGDSR